MGWSTDRIHGHPLAVSKIPGQRELILRLPSLLAMGFAVWLVYRIGRRLFGVEAGAQAAMVFAAVAAYYAAEARPYAFGLLCACGAILFLIRWMDNRLWVDAVAYSAFAAMTVYFHFLFSTVFAAHLIYVLIRRAPPLQVISVAVLTAALFVPAVESLLRVMGAAAGYTFISKPRLASIAHFLNPFTPL